MRFKTSLYLKKKDENVKNMCNHDFKSYHSLISYYFSLSVTTSLPHFTIPNSDALQSGFYDGHDIPSKDRA